MTNHNDSQEKKNSLYQLYLSGGGEMGELIRSKDWSQSSLGIPDTWPVNLLITLGILLNSRFPMFLFWGDECIQFYNDAYRFSLGNNGKHPSALGSPGAKTWEERWPDIQQRINHVMNTGESTWNENERIFLSRNNHQETTYWTYSYSQVKNETGAIAGILVICRETTPEVENQKKIQQLNEQLSSANEEMAASNEELTATNEELTEAQTDLQALFIRLSENESRLRSLVEQIPVAINVFNTRDLVIEMANDRMLEIWDRKADVMSKPLLVAMPELTGQPFLKRLDDVLTTGKAYYSNDEQASILRNGKLEECYFNIIYQPITEADGSINSILQIAMEVTEDILSKKHIQDLNEELATINEELTAGNEELRALNEEMQVIYDDLVLANAQLTESEERFRTMAEGTDILIAVGNETSNAVYFNKAWTDFTGKTLAELLNFGWIDLVHPEDKERYVNIYLTAFKDRVAFTGEFRLLHKDGKYRWMLAKGPARFRSDGSFAGYISSCVDITEQKRDEERKNDFIGMVSHELKTPLTSLSGYLELLQWDYKEGNYNRSLGLLEKAGKQAIKMANMINSFLNVSRLESGKLEMDKTHFDMADLLKEAAEEALGLYGSHNLIFYPVEPTMVDADMNKIGHVINNLISNAVKYSPPGSTIRISCITVAGMAQVSVKDEGIGIEQADTGKLFERYYRVRSTSTQSISGFGIGLYLCAEIIKQHDGKIWVESDPGNGSAFYFTLPVLSGNQLPGR